MQQQHSRLNVFQGRGDYWSGWPLFRLRSRKGHALRVGEQLLKPVDAVLPLRSMDPILLVMSPLRHE